MIIDKPVEECLENVKEPRLFEKASPKNENNHKCSSWTLYIVLFLITFTINNGISAYFVYSRWYLKKNIPRVKLNTDAQIIIH